MPKRQVTWSKAGKKRTRYIVEPEIPVIECLARFGLFIYDEHCATMKTYSVGVIVHILVWMAV